MCAPFKMGLPCLSGDPWFSVFSPQSPPSPRVHPTYESCLCAPALPSGLARRRVCLCSRDRWIPAWSASEKSSPPNSHPCSAYKIVSCNSKSGLRGSLHFLCLPPFLPRTPSAYLAPDSSLNRAVGASWGVGDLIFLPSLPALSLHRWAPDKERKLQQEGLKDDSRSNSQIWSSGKKRDRLESTEPVHLVRET